MIKELREFQKADLQENNIPRIYKKLDHEIENIVSRNEKLLQQSQSDTLRLL